MSAPDPYQRHREQRSRDDSVTIALTAIVLISIVILTEFHLPILVNLALLTMGAMLIALAHWKDKQ